LLLLLLQCALSIFVKYNLCTYLLTVTIATA